MAISELQTALIGAGVVAVAAVWGYNAWQERRHRKSTEAMFDGTEQDALLKGVDSASSSLDAGQHEAPDERIEPYVPDLEAPQPAAPDTQIDSSGAGTSATPADPVTAAVATIDMADTADALPELPPLSQLPVKWADPFVDCILHFTAADGIPASGVWAVQVAWAAGLSKPLNWLARDHGEAEWKLIDAHDSGRYPEWAVALQLVDRRGPISDSELGRFMDGVSQVAKQVDATLDLPMRGDTVLRAAGLDDVCAAVDIQFSVHIVEASGGVFAGTKLRGVAEAGGLSLGDDGRFHARDAAGAELFTLSNLGAERFDPATIKSLATQGLTLTLDVPRVAEGAMAFDQMLTTAQTITRALGGVLVDAQRVALAEPMVNGIRAKIIELQQTMRNAGIEPGSTRALRLFS